MDVVRSRSFGVVAEEYERYRLGYSDEMVAVITESATEPIDTAIEIGAGTGKATRVFARAGIEVIATEPDLEMLRVLQRECDGLPVRTVNAAFEDLDAAALGRHDLLYAAAALHWTRPEGRWDRVAALLRPGGLVASFGGPFEVAELELVRVAAELDQKYGVRGSIDFTGSVPATDDLEWPGSELAADERFTDVRQAMVPRRLELDAQAWIGQLNTVSAYRMLADDVREALFAELRERMPDRIKINGDLVLHTARLGR